MASWTTQMLEIIREMVLTDPLVRPVAVLERLTKELPGQPLPTNVGDHIAAYRKVLHPGISGRPQPVQLKNAAQARAGLAAGPGQYSGHSWRAELAKLLLAGLDAEEFAWATDY